MNWPTFWKITFKEKSWIIGLSGIALISVYYISQLNLPLSFQTNVKVANDDQKIIVNQKNINYLLNQKFFGLKLKDTFYRVQILKISFSEVDNAYAIEVDCKFNLLPNSSLNIEIFYTNMKLWQFF